MRQKDKLAKLREIVLSQAQWLYEVDYEGFDPATLAQELGEAYPDFLEDMRPAIEKKDEEMNERFREQLEATRSSMSRFLDGLPGGT